MIAMPGQSYSGPLPPLSEHQIKVRDALYRDIKMLAGEIGERHIWQYENLNAAADYIEIQMQNAGYTVKRQSYEAAGKTCYNIEAQVTGATQPNQILIIGGHYDSVRGSPAANDNATGTAGVLALSRWFATKKTARTLRFVAFVNEEAPFTAQSNTGMMMGSWVYANRCKQRGEKILAMLSLETMGFYSDQPHSQQYPYKLGLLYPSTGHFITFVGNIRSRSLVRQALATFRQQCPFPSEGIALPQCVRAARRSDHWSFWEHGYPGFMVTDTANFRYPHYHTPHDTPNKIDYDRLARVIVGLEKVIKRLATPETSP